MTVIAVMISQIMIAVTVIMIQKYDKYDKHNDVTDNVFYTGFFAN